MQKKFISFIFLIIISITTPAFAEDLPENIMVNPQMGLFVGKIINISKSNYTLEPITVMMGTIKNKQITVNKFKKYYGTTVKPKKNDYIVAKLIYNNKIDESWVFKASSPNYKTLKLICSPSYDIVQRYQKYINNGDYIKAQQNLNNKFNFSSNSKEDLNKTKDTLVLKNKSKISTSQYAMLSLLIIAMLSMCIYSYKNKHK